MRKLYAFLLSLFVLAMVVSSTAQAQSYAMSAYLLQWTNANQAGNQTYGSDAAWNGFTDGTPFTGQVTQSGYNYYYYCSSPVQFPFSFRFLNTTFTTNNYFCINGCGSVILSPNWQSGTPYDVYAYYGGAGYSMYDYSRSSGGGSPGYWSQGGCTPYDWVYSESSPYYYPNYKAAAFEYYNYDYTGGSLSTAYSYKVVGSAPNRCLIVQTLNSGSYGNYAYVGTALKEDHQVMIYENGISKFQFNYHYSGANRTRGLYSTYYHWGWGYSYTYDYGSSSYMYYYGYGGCSGIKELGGNYMLFAFNRNQDDGRSVSNVVQNMGTNLLGAPYWAYSQAPAQYTLTPSGARIALTSPSGWSVPYIENDNFDLTDKSVMLFIAWSNDLAASSIVFPANQDVVTKNAVFFDTVEVSNNGTATPTSATFRRRVTPLGGSSASPYYTQDISFPATTGGVNALQYATFNTLNNSSATESGKTVTVTTTANHGFGLGQKVNVSGMSIAGYNGTWFITSVASNSYTYTNTVSGLANANAGTSSSWVWSNSSGASAPLPPTFTTYRYLYSPSIPGATTNPVGSPIPFGIYEDTLSILSVNNTTLSLVGDQAPADNVLASEWIVAPDHDVKAISIPSFPAGFRTPVGSAAPVSIKFRNIGACHCSELKVGFIATVKNNGTGVILGRDTQYVATADNSLGSHLPPSTFLDTTISFFGGNGFVFPSKGTYTVCGMVYYSGDQLSADDTVCNSTIAVVPEHDVTAIDILYPQPDQEIPAYTSWKPAGEFKDVGVVDEACTPGTVIIRRCSDGQIVFKADSGYNNDCGIPDLYTDLVQPRQFFWAAKPSTGGFNIATVPPGCYTICAYSNKDQDGDRTNDTACSSFAIIDRLKGDIYVGKNQRFQSLHAAVDSMKYRGIGGNLNLILTDPYYSENGSYVGVGQSVSSPYGALDFTGIRGLSDTSRLTITVKQGGVSRVTFVDPPSGSNQLKKPFGFYFGDLLGGYITFEGYNPLGVPQPDKPYTEPLKRQLTIVDSTSTAGGIFSMEYGVIKVSLRNMNLIGNGSRQLDAVLNPPNATIAQATWGFGRDSDAVIRIFNDASDASYRANIKDTLVMHDIKVENCFIGNAKYGIYDHQIGHRFGRVGQQPYGYPKLGADGWTANWSGANNVFTRNQIGTAQWPISYAGIQFNNERDLTISRNVISNVNSVKPAAGYSNPYYSGSNLGVGYGPNSTVGNAAFNGTNMYSTAFAGNAYGIVQPDVRAYIPLSPFTPSGTGYSTYWPGDSGVCERVWIDGNRIDSMAGINVYGIAVNQSSYTRTQATWTDTLPVNTRVRVTNNMIYGLQGVNASGSPVAGAPVYPIYFATVNAPTGSASSIVAATLAQQPAGNPTILTPQPNLYSTDRDSVFENSISTKTATYNVAILNSKHPFVWNNVIQNATPAANYTNYWFAVPRPFTNAISSNYNLFDQRTSTGIDYTFARIDEYVRTGNSVAYTIAPPARTFRRLNDWRTYMAQDMNSVVGDPLFGLNADSLHMPLASSSQVSPASNNGAYLSSASQKFDFDGDLRSGLTPDIGADEWDGFQYSNDLTVLSITQPAGYSRTSDTTRVTIENPLWITALVKNLSSSPIFSRTVGVTLEVALSGQPYQMLWSSTSSPMNWDVNETKSVYFMGPNITATQAAQGVFRATITVPSDQNNGNNSAVKLFTVALKQAAVVVSYTSKRDSIAVVGANAPTLVTVADNIGLRNRDSVTQALTRLSIPYDLLDRASYVDASNVYNDVDYTPYWTLIWCPGNPTSQPVSLTQAGSTVNASTGNRLGSANLSFKEEQEVERFLNMGTTLAKKSVIMAGQNIAWLNDNLRVNQAGAVSLFSDTEFTRQYLHVKAVANSASNTASYGTPVSYGTYFGPTVPAAATTGLGYGPAGSTLAGLNGIASATIANGGVSEAINTVTVNTTAVHGFSAGQTVIVSGVAVNGYNGFYTITSVPTTTSFTYQDGTAGLAASGAGTAIIAGSATESGTTATITTPTPHGFSAGQTVTIAGIPVPIATNTAAISSTSEATNTVTINTTTAHGLVVGNYVTVAGVLVAGYNGTYQVTAVPSGTQFQYTDPTAAMAASSAGTATIASALEPLGGTTVLITTNGAHGLSVGQVANIAGVNVNGYNGAPVITGVPTPNTFTYTASAGLAPSVGGMVTTAAGGYNGTYTIGSTPTSTTFTYTLAAAGMVASAGGTATSQFYPMITNNPGRASKAILGQQPAFWSATDSIISLSPDVVAPSLVTPLVGPEVNNIAYAYAFHPVYAGNLTGADSAATTYYNPTYNSVFFGFDWIDPLQSLTINGVSELGGLTSGTTRVLSGALAFVSAHQGIILAVEFSDLRAIHTGADKATISWKASDQGKVDHFEIETKSSGAASANAWTNLGNVAKAGGDVNSYSFTHEAVDANRGYSYHIVAVDLDGSKAVSSEFELGPVAPEGITLGQNYPNPANGMTDVRFTLPTASEITLRVLDVTGKVVMTTISNEMRQPGDQKATLDLTNLPNGSYVYELVATDANGQSVTLSKKLTLTK